MSTDTEVKTKAKPEAFTVVPAEDGMDAAREYLVIRMRNGRGWELSVVKFDGEPHIAVQSDGRTVFEPPVHGVGLDAYPDLKVPAYVRRECARMLQEARSWGGEEDAA